MVYVVHRPQIFKVDRLQNTLAYELASKVVSLIVATPKEFVHQFNMARKIAGETSRSVILYATFGASATFPKKAFENDDHNDFVVPESYYAHRTTRSVREIMDSYSFKGFDVKRSDVQTLSILSRGDSSIISSSSEESKAETKETKGSSSFNIVLKCLNLDLLHASFRRYVNQPVDLVVSSEYDRERVSKFLETHQIKTHGVRVASTSSAQLTIWEHPEEFTSKSVMSRLDLSSSSSSTLCSSLSYVSLPDFTLEHRYRYDSSGRCEMSSYDSSFKTFQSSSTCTRVYEYGSCEAVCDSSRFESTWCHGALQHAVCSTVHGTRTHICIHERERVYDRWRCHFQNFRDEFGHGSFGNLILDIRREILESIIGAHIVH